MLVRKTSHFTGHGDIITCPNSKVVKIRVFINYHKTISDPWGKYILLPI